MVRWESDSRGRLEQAALDLYSTDGFDQTTVAQIAERAGLTERTFFRHFADKREVLFGATHALRDLISSRIAEAADISGPLDAVAAAVSEAEILFPSDRESARQRQQIIACNVELQERDAMKLASLAIAMAAALRARGTADPVATLAADAGVSIFKLAFERWVDESNDETFHQLIQNALDELRSLTE